MHIYDCSTPFTLVQSPKIIFFPKQVEFVDVNIGSVKEQHVLLKTWTAPVDIRDVVAFIAFGMFYVNWIPCYEVKIASLRQIINADH